MSTTSDQIVRVAGSRSSRAPICPVVSRAASVATAGAPA
jgi:hypothetical protein